MAAGEAERQKRDVSPSGPARRADYARKGHFERGQGEAAYRAESPRITRGRGCLPGLGTRR